tara:strand:- start:1038 stop:1508 length:471 start_codon:yes stop_codon:yes gene_type:complete
MLNKPNPYLFTIFLILIYGCGFKVVDKSKLINFKIETIVTSGEKRLNYKIKNKVLLNSNDQSNRRIQIDLKSERKKSVKEKNIKNEITKYEVMVITKIIVTEINNLEKIEFSVSKIGDYVVTDQYSKTLNNERKLLDILTNKISEAIIEKLTQKFK